MQWSKYHNKKCSLDGYNFDSVKEMKYYVSLRLRKKAKDIKDFKVKPRIELQPSFVSGNKKIRAIVIEPDFFIYHNNGILEYCDTKGYWPDASKLKWKMLQFKFKDNKKYKFTII